ncbi:MAG: phosphoribosyltransferase [Polyangiales bacterium]
MRPARFTDRHDAGRQLAIELYPYAQSHPLVLALPRGGAPIGFEVARELGAELDVLVVRKLGVPWHPELAMGAIASGGITFVDEEIARQLEIPKETVEAVVEKESRELARREALYRHGKKPIELRGRTVILVDDGLATGASMRVAIAAIRTRDPARVVVAVPVASAEACESLRHLADDVVCPRTPDPFIAVGLWYRDFSQTDDDEVRRLLDAAQHAPFAHSA